jgi:catechol 2,3-dioxygenase-like lactoylglutathione lyase family enzyme
MNIEFLSTIAVVAADPPASRRLYVDTLGLPLGCGVDGEYFHSEQLAGVKHFGVWPLSQAAQACFGAADWPADRPVPQISVEFDGADPDAVHAAADELIAAGYEILHPVRKEPWGQTVVRLQSIEGAIVGVSYAPSLHD